MYGLSNHLLNTPWPKVVRGMAQLSALSAKADLAGDLFDLLSDRTPAADASLPDTGLERERERALSASHIVLGPPEDWTAVYGTRCATVLTLDAEGRANFEERTFTHTAQIDAIAGESFVLAGSS